MATISRLPQATKSMAPPIPLTILPGIIQLAILPDSSTSIAPITVRSTCPPRIIAKDSELEKELPVLGPENIEIAPPTENIQTENLIKLINSFKNDGTKVVLFITPLNHYYLSSISSSQNETFNQTIKLKLVSDNSPDAILEGITDKITVDEKSTAETFWLTKVLGDYNINKVGENFMFDNNGQAMLMKRVD